MARQDVVAVVLEVTVAVEIDLDGPVKAELGSDRMTAIVSDGMAAMDSTMVTMRGSKWAVVAGDTVSEVVSLRAIDGQTVMRWKQVQKVDRRSQVASHLTRITQSDLSQAVQRQSDLLGSEPDSNPTQPVKSK